MFLTLVTSFDSLDGFLSWTSRHETRTFSFLLMIEESEKSVEVLCVEMDIFESTDFFDDLRSLWGGGPMSQCDMVNVSASWVFDGMRIVEVCWVLGRIVLGNARGLVMMVRLCL